MKENLKSVQEEYNKTEDDLEYLESTVALHIAEVGLFLDNNRGKFQESSTFSLFMISFLHFWLLSMFQKSKYEDLPSVVKIWPFMIHSTVFFFWLAFLFYNLSSIDFIVYVAQSCIYCPLISFYSLPTVAFLFLWLYDVVGDRSLFSVYNKNKIKNKNLK